VVRLRRVTSIAAALALVVACSSGSPKTAPGRASGPIAFTVSSVDVQSVNPPARALPDVVKTKVMATLDAYVDRASAAPLRSGSRAGDLTALFTSSALARVSGPDRRALVDEGLPPAADVRAPTSTAKLGALAGADNSVEVVTATIDLRLQTVGASPLAITRTGDLVLVADGDTWKIDGYDLSTARDSGDGPATTTARR